MPVFRPPSKRRARIERVRFRRDPEPPSSQSLLMFMLAFATLWLIVLSMNAAVAGAATGRVAVPRLASPADDIEVQDVPSFSWRPVKRAAKYEFQLAADARFESVVLGAGRRGFFTRNTSATVSRALADGDYHWRVRAIDARDRAGRWSPVRSIQKRWTARPVLLGPTGETVAYPTTPVVLRWAPVPGAFKYLVRVATDPTMAHSALGPRLASVETSGTDFAIPLALAPGRYYWDVTPLDSRRHPGRSSNVASFGWAWPSFAATRFLDLDSKLRPDGADLGVDPLFDWDPVAGAAEYEVEVSTSQDFAAGSRVCCDERVIGTSLSPLHVLPNNRYFWRVRAIDLDGNAGVWNFGGLFTKDFNNVTPSIPNLHIRDNMADRAPSTGPSGLPTTDSPVVSWDPAHRQSSYEVSVAPWEAPGFCNWTAATPTGPQARTFLTAATSWTPLGPFTSRRPVSIAFPTVAHDRGWHLVDGTSYCVRVRARSDRDAARKEVVSPWTQLNGLGHAAFTYRRFTPATCTPARMSSGDDYLAPEHNGEVPRLPLFTWKRVPGACGYFVVVARDPEFTKIVDVALTTDPAYAPRAGGTLTKVTTYNDENTDPNPNTSFHWAVLPTRDPDGDGLSTEPLENHPRIFRKRAIPPAQLLSPAPGARVGSQPTFSWSAVEGARDYRIQVAADDGFADPIVDARTSATAYTGSDAFPSDSELFWRVRANDENGTGLPWSQVQSFHRVHPVPSILSNPTSGEGIPVLSWAPVQGAVSYDMHVEQANGTKRDFTMRSTAFTPTAFYGTGVWHWQVRANFRSGRRLASGGFFAPQPFTRHIATPSGVKTVKAGRSALLAWDPALMAQRYRVQISATDSFSRIIEETTTDNTSWAPAMMSRAYDAGGPLWWRVAVVDEGRNLGGWATRPLRKARRMRLRVAGRLRAGATRVVRVSVRSAAGRRIKRAVVRVRGAGVTSRPRLTNRRGVVRLHVTPRNAGVVRFSVDKFGYVPARAKLRVRR